MKRPPFPSLFGNGRSGICLLRLVCNIKQRVGRRRRDVFLIFFGLLWLAAGLAAHWEMTQREGHLNVIKKWPVHPARIVSSEVVRFESRTGRDLNIEIRAYPRVVYSYDAKGRPHTNETQKPSYYEGGGFDYANRMVYRFPAGSAAQVRVNPFNPYESELEGTEPEAGINSGKVVTLVLAAIGFGMVVAGILRRFGPGTVGQGLG